MFASMKRAAAVAATLALMGGAGILAATTAGASTTGCTAATGSLAGSCGDQVNVYGNGWDVYGQKAAYNNKIIAYPDFDMTTTPATQITTDQATDFYTFNTTPGNPDERVFEYAPNGVPSNLCVADPMGGGVPASDRDGLVLRTCNGSNYQKFVGTATLNTNGTQWKNVASGQIVQPNGTKAQLSTVATVNNRTGSYWGWNSPATVPAG